MRFAPTALDGGTTFVLLYGTIAFALVLGFALTGNVAAEAGHEASACMSRFT